MQTTTAVKTETLKRTKLGEFKKQQWRSYPSLTPTPFKTWEERVRELEDLGADRSDAQSVIDAEDNLIKGGRPETLNEALAALDQARKTMEQRAHGLLD